MMFPAIFRINIVYRLPCSGPELLVLIENFIEKYRYSLSLNPPKVLDYKNS